MGPRFGDVFRFADGSGTVMVLARNPVKQHTYVVSVDGFFVGAVTDEDMLRWEAVVDDPRTHEYLFVGGPWGGQSHPTGGVPQYRVAMLPPIMPVYDDGEITTAALPGYEVVDYELRRDGRYHLVGSA